MVPALVESETRCVPGSTRQKAGWAFLSAFGAIYFLWGGIALYLHIQNKGVLTQKMAHIFPLDGNAGLLIMITALVGALVAGFAAMSAALLRGIEK